MTAPNETPAARQAQDPSDPKGLIRESYRIDGITEGECRSILLDWALSLPADSPAPTAMAHLLARHAPLAPDHPMTTLLGAGLAPLPQRPTRSRDPLRRRARPFFGTEGA